MATPRGGGSPPGAQFRPFPIAVGSPRYYCYGRVQRRCPARLSPRLQPRRKRPQRAVSSSGCGRARRRLCTVLSGISSGFEAEAEADVGRVEFRLAARRFEAGKNWWRTAEIDRGSTLGARVDYGDVAFRWTSADAQFGVHAP